MASQVARILIFLRPLRSEKIFLVHVINLPGYFSRHGYILPVKA